MPFWILQPDSVNDRFFYDRMCQKCCKKYAAGKCLYVPKNEDAIKAWGEQSGYRKQLRKRNHMIINKFQYGVTIEELSKDNFLSEETVKKIVYSKKNTEELVFYPDNESAKEYDEKLPPLIISYFDNIFEINCNSPLHEALMRMDIKEFPVIIWITVRKDYEEFKQKYGEYVKFDYLAIHVYCFMVYY